MCNLYAMTRKDDDLARFLRVSHNRRAAFRPLNAIFPRNMAPVVRYSADGERELVLMTWGFMRLQEGRAPRPVTNVRDDQIQTNPFWRDSFRQRRCSCRRRRSASPTATSSPRPGTGSGFTSTRQEPWPATRS
jgi:putative SOS response-associated peptidase YedK